MSKNTCQSCNREPGRHPHVTWGGSLHHHGPEGNRRECHDFHAYCTRLDCDCGGRSRLADEKLWNEKAIGVPA